MKKPTALSRVLLVLAILAIPLVCYAQVRELRRGDALHAGQIWLSDGSSHGATIAVPALSANATITLPAATGTLSSSASALTANSVPYVGTGGVLTEDTTNLTWDATANANFLKLGAGTAAGQVRLLEGSGGGTNYYAIKAAATLAGNLTLVLPNTTMGDTAIPFCSAADTLSSDSVNFNFDDTANSNELTLGSGTAAGTIQLLEGSGGGTNFVGLTVPATVASNIEYTLPNALATTAGNFWTVDTAGLITHAPAQRILYASLAESAAHDGLTGAETTIMPATDEGTAETDIGTANMLAGAVFEYSVFVDAAGDADGDETLTVNVYFGAQLVGTTGAIAIDGATDLVLHGTVNLEAAGASIAGNYMHTGTANGGAVFTAFDTTAVQAFAVKLDWGGTTDAADTAKTQLAKLSVTNWD